MSAYVGSAPSPAHMSAYYVIRAGEIKMRLQGATVEADGAVCVKGCYVIDGELAKTDGCYPAVAAAAKARRWGSIDRRYFGRVGVSASGLEIPSQADYDARIRAAGEAADAAHPEWRERRAISALYAEADRVQYADTERYFNLLHQADARLATWRETYPQAAAEERTSKLRAAADHARHMALGALTYDADSSLSREYQEKAHAEWMEKAAAFDAQAEAAGGAA